MYTLSIQRWVGGRSLKVARRVALDQNGHSKTLHADPPTHQNNARLCTSHRCALFTTTISAVKPRPPAPDDRIFLLYFFEKAAELKRFRSHPLSSAVNPGTSRKSETSDTEELDQMHGALLRPQKEAQVHETNHGSQPICRGLHRDHGATRIAARSSKRVSSSRGTWEQASSTELAVVPCLPLSVAGRPKRSASR